MRTGLVLEGGAMRGMFTAGVLDVFMENNIEFDGGIGVSAGAIFGCNIKSRQIGRTIRYNKKYCGDRRYVSYLHWLKTGDLYPVEFDYYEIPNKLDVFDSKTYRQNKMDFYVVTTDVSQGGPHYQLCNEGDETDIKWMRASASMPVFANMVEIDGKEYSDGGTSDSVPLKYFESIGYDRNVVVMTQPKGYRKKKYKFMWFMKAYLKKYPMLVKSLEERYIMYNQTMDYIDEKEKKGEIIVIRPTELLKIKPSERNPQMLEKTYQMGRCEGYKYLDTVKAFLEA